MFVQLNLGIFFHSSFLICGFFAFYFEFSNAIWFSSQHVGNEERDTSSPESGVFDTSDATEEMLDIEKKDTTTSENVSIV